MTDRVYCYPPDYTVLTNKLDIRGPHALDTAERALVVARLTEGPPSGAFDLAHLCAIHSHLFQDVYEWAGELRRVEISKGGQQFQPRRFIEVGMADVHRRLVEQKFLAGLGADAFSAAAAHVIGDINYVHPFRDGNGRTQLVYLKQLGARADHDIDLALLRREAWLAASIAAFNGDYGPMSDQIRDACV